MNITELQIELIINRNLYKENMIDEETYTIVNEKLLKTIKMKEDDRNKLL